MISSRRDGETLWSAALDERTLYEETACVQRKARQDCRSVRLALGGCRNRIYDQCEIESRDLGNLYQGCVIFGAANIGLDGAGDLGGAEGEADLRGCRRVAVCGVAIYGFSDVRFCAGILDGDGGGVGGMGGVAGMESRMVAALAGMGDWNGGVFDQYGGDFWTGELVGGDGDGGTDVEPTLILRKFRWLAGLLHDISAA